MKRTQHLSEVMLKCWLFLVNRRWRLGVLLLAVQVFPPYCARWARAFDKYASPMLCTRRPSQTQWSPRSLLLAVEVLPPYCTRGGKDVWQICFPMLCMRRDSQTRWNPWSAAVIYICVYPILYSSRYRCPKESYNNKKLPILAIVNKSFNKSG